MVKLHSMELAPERMSDYVSGRLCVKWPQTLEGQRNRSEYARGNPGPGREAPRETGQNSYRARTGRAPVTR